MVCGLSIVSDSPSFQNCSTLPVLQTISTLCISLAAWNHILPTKGQILPVKMSVHEWILSLFNQFPFENDIVPQVFYALDSLSCFDTMQGKI